jgi:hypothetical protein
MSQVYQESTAHSQDEQVQVERFVENRLERTFDLSGSPVAQAFYFDEERISQIIGPVGSGKSVATMQKIIRLAGQQTPSFDGVRRTRWAVVRNTYAQLEDTTIKTWMAWFPSPAWGKYKVAKTTYEMKWQIDDGTIVECEILFRALDRPDQVDNLLSAEFTGAWFNESRHIDRNIFDMMDNRVGRYPDPATAKCSWMGIVMDTNPPDEDHWIYKLFEEQRPEGFKLFHQPSGLSPEAENVNNLPENYYKNACRGKDDFYIHVYIHGKYGYLRTGKPVYPEYNDTLHCKHDLKPLEGVPLYIGVDFGLTPACAICQLTPHGQLLVLDEVLSDRAGIQQFLSMVRPYLKSEYPDHKVEAWICDPAGEQSAQTDMRSPFDVMRDEGIFPWRGEMKEELRLESVKQMLTKMVDGEPALLLHPNAAMLRKGFTGHYQYRRMQVSKERYTDRPDKNEASHVHDALQYLCSYLFGGYGVETTHRAPRVVGVSARRGY